MCSTWLGSSTWSDPPGFASVLAAVAEGGLLTDDEAAWARSYVAAALNAAVRSAAQAHGWRYVGGLADAFARHGYCSVDSWMVSLLESAATQADVNGAFHPNRAGHVAYGQAIADDVRRSSTPTASAGSEVLGAPDAPGDVYVLVDDTRAVTAVALRDTGAGLLPLGGRRLVEVAAGSGNPAATPIGPVAADAVSAVAAWNEGWSFWTSYQAFAAPVAIVEDLEVAEARLVQAPADATFAIADHPTYVQATLRASVATSRLVDVRTEVVDDGGGVVLDRTSSVRVEPGDNVVVLPVDAPFELQAGTSATATVTVVDPPTASRADNNVAISPPVEVQEGREVRITFVPTETQDDTSTTCPQAATTAGVQSRHLVAAVPVLEVRSQLACTPPNPIAASDPGIMAALVELDELAHLTGQDAVVGVVPAGWLQRVSGQAIGITGVGLRGILIEAGTNEFVLAHELAHTLGVDHTLGLVPAAGVRVPSRTVRRGSDWMHFRAVERAWTGGATWDQMVGSLGGPESVPQVPVPAPGTVFVRGHVALDGTYVRGRWTTGGSAGGGDGDLEDLVLNRMVARLHDGATSVDVPIPLTELAPQLGPDGQESDLGARGYGLSWPIDVPAGTDRLELLLDGELVDAQDVSANAPTVSVTGPTAGQSVSRGEQLTVTWSAADADGDALSFDVLISDDGGTSWKPLATGVTGSSHSVVAPADVNSDQVVVRVVASDGLHLAQDDSDPFSVAYVERGPEEIAYGSIGRNVEGCGEAAAINCRHGLRAMAPDGTEDRPLVEFEPPVAGFTPPSGITELTRVWGPANPAFSPDGRSLAFQVQWEDPYFRAIFDRAQTGIAVADHDGGDRRIVTAPMRPPGSTSRWLDMTCPSWSPDGSRLAFRGDPRDDTTRRYLMTVGADGSDVRIAGVHAHATGDACPSWSPDGSRLMVAVARGSYDDPALWPAELPAISADTKWALLTWDAAGSDAAVGEVAAFVRRDVDASTGQPIGTVDIVGETVQEPDGSTLVVQTGTWLCGIVRISADGADQQRVMTCPRKRIVVEGDPPGTGRPNITGYAPVHLLAAPDGRLAVSSGTQFWYTDLDQYGGFAPSLCTIPGDSIAEPLLTADFASDFVPPGHECVTGPGTAAPYPSVTTAFGQLHHTWSAGAELDGGGGGGLVAIPEEPAAPAASAGGPYAGVVGEPVLLDAGASALLSGPDAGTALVEWDLDGDGDHDDAVGTRPTVHFESPGTREIRVRITPAGGTGATSEPAVAAISARPDATFEPAPDSSDPAGPVPAAADVDVTGPAGEPMSLVLALVGGGTTAFELVTAPDPAEVGVAVPGGGPDGTGGLVTGPDGVVELLPVPGFVGTVSFTYRVAGTDGPLATATVHLVAPPAPTAGPDELSVTAGTVEVVDPADLLANDDDPAGGLTVVGVRSGAGVTAWLALDGTVQVVAPAAGTGEFRYVVASTTGATAEATVTVVAAAVGSPPGPPAPVPQDGPTIERISGSTRYETAAEVARAHAAVRPTTTGVLARGDAFADALAAANVEDGVPLLTDPSTLSGATREVIRELGLRAVTIVGGTSAVSAAVEAELRQLGVEVTRIAGVDRYDTARRAVEGGHGVGQQTSAEIDGVPTALLASGETFPDALAAGPVAMAGRLPLLLTASDRLPIATLAALAGPAGTCPGERCIEQVVLVGGTAAIGAGVESQLRALGITVRRIAGGDRAATAVALARFAAAELPEPWTVDHVNLARGDAYPDALAGARLGGAERAPTLLTVDDAALGAATAAFLRERSSAIRSVHVLGGPTAVRDEVLEAVRAAFTTG